MSVCLCVRVCVRVCVFHVATSGVGPQVPFSFSLRQGFSLAGTSPQTSLPGLRTFWDPPISASHLTTSEVIGTATVRSYFRRSWGL